MRAAHGVRGELRIEPLTDFSQRFAPGATVWVGDVQRTVRRARPYRDSMLLLAIEGVETWEAAQAICGALLQMPESELPSLPEGAYYRFQLIGMDVVDVEGRRLGQVEEILETGANDVYVVRGREGELLLPAIDSVIKQVDLTARRMVIAMPEGLERR